MIGSPKAEILQNNNFEKETEYIYAIKLYIYIYIYIYNIFI